MKHARMDYEERIQDSEGLIPHDEPVFLIRGQDALGPAVVEHWANLAERAGVAPEVVEGVRTQAGAMREWQRDYGSKVADVPEGAMR